MNDTDIRIDITIGGHDTLTLKWKTTLDIGEEKMKPLSRHVVKALEEWHAKWIHEQLNINKNDRQTTKRQNR